MIDSSMMDSEHGEVSVCSPEENPSLPRRDIGKRVLCVKAFPSPPRKVS